MSRAWRTNVEKLSIVGLVLEVLDVGLGLDEGLVGGFADGVTGHFCGLLFAGCGMDGVLVMRWGGDRRWGDAKEGFMKGVLHPGRGVRG